MEQEYTCSVTLIVLGESLEPDVVTKELMLTPNQSWTNGEQKQFIRSDGSKRAFDSYHEWGGWKKFIPDEVKGEYLEEQLQHWCNTLQEKKTGINALKSTELDFVLDIFICTDSTASVIIPEALQREIYELGVELHISFETHGK
jgi:hypothetical protein